MPSTYLEKLGARLERAIEDVELSKRGFCEQMGQRGLEKSPQTLQNYIHAHTSPSAEYLHEAARILGRDPAWLFAGIGPEAADPAATISDPTDPVTGRVVALPLWRVGINDLVEADGPEAEVQIEGFRRALDGKTAKRYLTYTPLVRVAFGNALARWLKSHSEKERRRPETRARLARWLTEYLQDPLPGFPGSKPPAETRERTDYALASLLARMLAFPKRP